MMFCGHQLSVLQQKAKERMVSTLDEAQSLASQLAGSGFVENQGLKDRILVAIDAIQEGLVERETEVA